MPTLLKILLFHLLIFYTTSLLAFNIVLDPGHGGSDKGANRGSFIEADIVYKITEKLKANLDLKPNMNSYITRSSENGMTLKERVQLAHEKAADLFLSLHANSSPSNQVSGMEYYFSTQKAAPVFLKTKPVAETAKSQDFILQSIKDDLFEFGKTKQSLDFSKKIQTAWLESEFGKKQSRTSKIRRAPFYVIENTRMPSVLVEVGFISNQREARKLITDVYQNELAHALTEAIIEFKDGYKEKSDK
ncbi:MAG: N-acetylmuramoyl-L-alanine amidase [Pseudobdellovibrio sp.]